MTTIQSVIDRVTYTTKDTDHVRWTWPELALWLNDAVGEIATLHPRAASQYKVLTLTAGARQDLRVLDPATRWIRLYDVLCNVVTAAGTDTPTGATVRQISRPALDHAFRTWRGKSPTAKAVSEFALDERDVYTFDVNPPVVAGTKVYALAAVKPDPCAVLTSDGTALANPTEVFPLPDGYDIPAVDYVLFRLFSKDANDQSYSTQAGNHLQAFQLAMGVETKDAAAS